MTGPSPRGAVGSRRSGSVAMSTGDVLLDVKDLTANVADTQILNGINLKVIEILNQL